MYAVKFHACNNYREYYHHDSMILKSSPGFAKTQEFGPRSESTNHHFPERLTKKEAAFRLEIVRISPSGEELDCDDQPSAISQFPFLIGRHSRENRHLGTSATYLVEDPSPYNVSRKHCSVGIFGDQLEVIDHGSTLGTRVNGCRIGTAVGQMQAPLRMGDNEIVLGSSDRGRHFRITVSRKAD